MKSILINIASVVFPSGSRRRQLIKNALLNNKLDAYGKWIKKVEPQIDCNLDDLKKCQWKPLISIIVPCYNTPKKYFVPMIKSVCQQIYANWELVVVDGSEDDDVALEHRKICDQYARIIYTKIDKNQGIVGNTNIGIKKAKGAYIAFLDHDDTLSKRALAEVVIELNKDKKIDLVYSDEDKLTDDGKLRLLPFFKPDWSPELLRSVNYITHFVVARKDLVEKIGYLRKGFDGAQDYDFLLRLTEITNKVKHIPKILYHWRMAEGSTAGVVTSKSYADSAGRRALGDYVKRNHIDARVIQIKDRPTNYRLKYKVNNEPLASIIIPYKDRPELLKNLIESIAQKTSYKKYEIILVSNNSISEETISLQDNYAKKTNFTLVICNDPFNYSHLNNIGRSYAKGQLLVFLNNDMEVINNGWLEELVGVATQNDVGIVGGLLLYPNNQIQHAGIVMGMGGMAGHPFRNRLENEWTPFGLPDWPRDYIAVTGACMAIRTTLFDKAGGFDEGFVMCGSDVSLCIKVCEMGYRNIFWPYAKLMHHESLSVESYSKAPARDYNKSLTYYKPYLKSGDCFFNPNLDINNEYISIKEHL
jgi:GT2 family glycosyltransferase